MRAQRRPTGVVLPTLARSCTHWKPPLRISVKKRTCASWPTPSAVSACISPLHSAPALSRGSCASRWVRGLARDLCRDAW